MYIITALIPHGSELKATAVESKLIYHRDAEELILRIHLKSTREDGPKQNDDDDDSIHNIIPPLSPSSFCFCDHTLLFRTNTK